MNWDWEDDSSEEDNPLYYSRLNGYARGGYGGGGYEDHFSGYEDRFRTHRLPARTAPYRGTPYDGDDPYGYTWQTRRAQGGYGGGGFDDHFEGVEDRFGITRRAPRRMQGNSDLRGWYDDNEYGDTESYVSDDGEYLDGVGINQMIFYNRANRGYGPPDSDDSEYEEELARRNGRRPSRGNGNGGRPNGRRFCDFFGSGGGGRSRGAGAGAHDGRGSRFGRLGGRGDAGGQNRLPSFFGGSGGQRRWR